MNKATIIMLAAALQPVLGYAQNAGESLDSSFIASDIDFRTIPEIPQDATIT